MLDQLTDYIILYDAEKLLNDLDVHIVEDDGSLINNALEKVKIDQI